MLHVRLIDSVVETQAGGDLLIRRVPQDGIAAADQHRHIRFTDMKTIEQLLCLAVMIEIDVGVRMPVARQELFHPQCGRAVHGSEEHGVAKSTRDQLDAPEDERSHEDLAQFGVGLHEGKEPCVVELDDFPRFDDTGPRQGAAACDHGRFAQELRRAVGDDDGVGTSGGAPYLNLPRHDNEEGEVLVTQFDQHFSLRDRAAAPVRVDPRHLRSREFGEQPFGRRGRVLERRYRGVGHQGFQSNPSFGPTSDTGGSWQQL